MKTQRVRSLLAAMLALGAADLRAQPAAPEDALAEALLAQPGLHAGLVVHVGCGDGALTAALRRRGMPIVQGLDNDPARVATARERIARQGAYGPLSAVPWSPPGLPYADDLVNVMVIDDPARVTAAGLTAAECVRALAPFGTLLVARDGADPLVRDLAAAGIDLTPASGGADGWLAGRKPYPSDMDMWPHYQHDAGHSNMSQDRRAGPVTGLRWIQGHYGMVGEFHPLQGAISSDGRNFYLRFVDGQQQAADRGAALRLEARDAFTGLPLWERTIWSEPSTVLDQRKAGPVVADGDRVFARLEKNGEVVALDGATGEVQRRLGIAGSPESCFAGRLVVREGRGTWAVVAPETGEVRRRFRVAESYVESPILIRDGRAVVLEAGAGERSAAYAEEEGRPAAAWWTRFRAESPPARGQLVCFDFNSGETLWRAPNAGDGRLFWFNRGLVVTRQGNAMNAFSGADGRHLWEVKVGTKKGEETAFFHFGDVIWGYGDARWYYAYDPETGKLLRSDRGRWKEFGRCGPDRATERYVLGMDFSVYDLREQEKRDNAFDCFFARADCGPGYYPANGLYYSYGHVCACGIYQHGILGVSCAPLADPDALRKGAGPDFVAGPALGAAPADATATDADWPTFRHDAARSDATPAAAPASPGVAWRTPLAAPLTAPVAVGDAVFVACPDAHRVVCLDAATGRTRWTFTAGGRVDSPPTWHEGRLLFGCRDGWAYALNAGDGRLAWRRRVAPADRQISVRGQLESVWPVYGAALVQNGTAYFCAGRHGDADGGVHFLAVEPATGRVVWRENVRGFPPYRSGPYVRLIEGRKTIPHDAYDEEKLKALDPATLGGIGFSFRNDVLVGDGRTVFVNAIGIDPEKRIATGAPIGRALYSQSGDLLTDSDLTTSKTQWAVAGNPQAPSWRSRRGSKPSAEGRLLAMDGDTFLAIDRRALRVGSKKAELAADRYPFALVACADHALVAARADAAGEGAAPGGVLQIYSRKDALLLREIPIDAVPAFDGMAVAGGRVFISGQDGSLTCLAEQGASVAAAPAASASAAPAAPTPPARAVAACLPAGDARAALLGAIGLEPVAVSDPSAAVGDPSVRLVIADAAPAALKALAGQSAALDAFFARGGWLMLWGLEPAGLGDFNRIVGVEHLIRPYELERVRRPETDDPLLSGVEEEDLDLCGPEPFGHGRERWPDPGAYGFVVDLDDIAPFCRWPEPGHFKSAGKPGTDRWPRNMVNGMWEWWKAGFVIDLRSGAPTKWEVVFPRRETIREVSVVPGFGYGKLRQIRLDFGEGRKPEVLNVEPDHVRQTFPIEPVAADRLEIAIADWDPSAAQPILGVDNIWIRVERSEDFRLKVKPLASIGVLVKYPRGSGGIVLNQLRVRDEAAIRAFVDEAVRPAGDGAGEKADEARAAAERQARAALRQQEERRQSLVRKLKENLIP